MELNLSSVWSSACSILKSELSDASYNSYITSLRPLSLENGRILLQVPDERVLATLNKQEYYNFIKSALVAASRRDLSPVFTIEEPRVEASAPSRSGLQLNPRYTFDTFVVGEGNRLACAAAKLAAEMPGNKYNPLFIYGGTGLGKTHLMHAIGNYVLSQNPHAQVIYVTSERFTNELITAIQMGKPDDFRNKYRGVDVLMVDDIQFIADKERTQDEFFHTFNVLHDSGKQIILTADKPPKGIAMLKERLASRFEGGLLADIFPPDYETRVAILAEKSRTERIVLEDDSVLPFIANIVKSNIRQLEGTLNRVVAFSNLTGKPITLELAQTALADYVSRPKVITAKDVQAAVCNYFSVSLVDLCSTRRSRELAVPRQIAMYLVRDMTDLSLPDIGKLFDKHHSTVLHACDKIGAERKENQSLNKTLEDIKSSLTE
ncbi:chromosomal replication initiator protein DnaA [Christensenella sp. MSJ-20]|uniref:chromosomal replication initiator protein DnaA n=1 Tax=Christensenella sp. MSJ-20 TaxID=2841518 RepID=UPI001C787C6D|nr:chromosomal replication initiator protein DnaA [Christensenella sp. MSJ-20]